MTADEAALQLADAYQSGNFESLIEAFANKDDQKAPLLFADDEQEPMAPMHYLIKMDAGTGSKLALLAFAVSNGYVENFFHNSHPFPVHIERLKLDGGVTRGSTWDHYKGPGERGRVGETKKDPWDSVRKANFDVFVPNFLIHRKIWRTLMGSRVG